MASKMSNCKRFKQRRIINLNLAPGIYFAVSSNVERKAVKKFVMIK